MKIHSCNISFTLVYQDFLDKFNYQQILSFSHNCRILRAVWTHVLSPLILFWVSGSGFPFYVWSTRYKNIYIWYTLPLDKASLPCTFKAACSIGLLSCANHFFAFKLFSLQSQALIVHVTIQSDTLVFYKVLNHCSKRKLHQEQNHIHLTRAIVGTHF